MSTASSTSPPRITPYAPGSFSSDLHGLWQSTIGKNHPPYSVSEAKFDQLLNADNARVFVAYAAPPASSSPSESTTTSSSSDSPERPHEPPLGFAITYLIKVTSSTNPDTSLRGSLAALVVAPDHQGQGIGSALHDAALSYLEKNVRTSLPAGKEGSLQLGSTFPRLFPGIPDIEYLRPAKEWFQGRGWTIAAPDAVDLYSPLSNGVDFDHFIAEAKKHGTEFRHARPVDREALMRLEFTEFDSFTGWPDMFPKMMSAGKYEDIVVAIHEGKIIGATFAALQPCPLLDALVWPSTLGKNCGSVACVGIAKAGRGTGAGVGMVAYAFKNLAERDADGVFIDWVGMKGFYERFGAKQWEAPYCDGSRKVTPGSEASATALADGVEATQASSASTTLPRSPSTQAPTIPSAPATPGP